MKPNLRTVAIALMLCVVAPKVGHSQVLISLLFGKQLNSGNMEFGLITGANVATMVGDPDDAKFTSSFKLGLFLDYKFSDHWAACMEANVNNSLGYRNISPAQSLFPIQDSILEGSNKSRRIIRTLQVPIYARYQFKNRFFIGAGGYLSYQHGTRDIINYTYNVTDLTIEQSFTKYVVGIDAGLVGAFGYQFARKDEANTKPGMSIRFKASYGLTNAFKESAGFSANHLWFSFDLAIPIVMSVL